VSAVREEATRPDPRLGAPDAAVLRPRADDPARIEAYLPSPCVQNHAAEIMPLADGDLGCVWFGGTQEGIPDISVYFSRLARGSDRWSEPVKLSDDPTRSEQNPLLFPTPHGELWLLHTAQRGGNQDTALVRRRVSRDNGHTWGPAETLFEPGPGYGVFVRHPPVVRADGAWVLPGWRCVKPASGPWMGDEDVSFVRISEDEGRSWTEHLVPDSTGCVHMSIVTLPAGEMLALFRSRWADFVYASRSHDGGRSWTAPAPTGLPNNNSSIQALALADGRIALVFNASSAKDATGRREGLYDDIGGGEVPAAGPSDRPARTAFWGAPRAPMTLALSGDGGRSWEAQRSLDVGDGFCMTNNSKDQLNREYSYPSIAQTPDGALHIAYTYFRRAIKYVRLMPDWVGR
jgi:predicted neuraminidase